MSDERWAYLLKQDLERKRRELEGTLRYRNPERVAVEPVVSGRSTAAKAKAT